MKKQTKIILIISLTLMIFGGAYLGRNKVNQILGATVLFTSGGGTGTSSPSGILYGSGSANALKTVTIGSNLTFTGGTLSSTASGSGGGSQFSTSTDTTGVYLNVAKKLGISTTSPYAPLSVVGKLGVVSSIFHATNTNATSTFAGAILFNKKVAAFPGLAIVGDTNTGITSLNPDQLDIATAGVQRLSISSDRTLSLQPVYTSDGSVSLPSYTFNSDTDNGLYFVGANSFALTAGGSQRLLLTTATSTFTGGLTTTTFNVSSATATSTFANGIRLTKGCFELPTGTCVGGGAGSGTVGSGSAGQFPFYNAAGTTLTATSSLFLRQNGNIGIGTTSPYARLSIHANNKNVETLKLTLFAIASSTASATTTLFSVNNQGNTTIAGIARFNGAQIIIPNGTAAKPGLTFVGESPNFYEGFFRTSNTEIGLSFLGTSNYRFNNTALLPSVSNNNDLGGTFNLWKTGYFNTSIFNPLMTGGTAVSSSLSLRSTSGVGTTDHIKFQVGNNGATEAVRIVNSGKVGIGTTTPWGVLSISTVKNPTVPNFIISTSTATATSTAFIVDKNGRVGVATTSPAGAFAVKGRTFLSNLTTQSGVGNVLCVNAGGEVVQDDSPITACSGASSIKVKNIIENLDPKQSLKDILALEPITYRYKKEYSSDQKIHLGFIAEEVAKIDPRLVEYDKNGEPIGLEYSLFAVKAISALQAQQEQIERLEQGLPAEEKFNPAWLGLLGLLGLVPLMLKRYGK